MKGTELHPLVPLEALPAYGEFLVLFEPRRVPPHLAWLCDGLYYSLSVKGVECGKDLEELFKALERKGKELLMMEVELPEGKEGVSSIFSAYRGKEPLLNSCLAPIRDRCGELSEEEVPTVHELIGFLKEKGLLRPPFRFHSSGPLPDRFILPAYGKEEVQTHLRRYRSNS